MKLTLNKMSSKFVVLICLALIANGCGDHYSSSEFKGTAIALQEARDYWLKNGRPADFQPGQFIRIGNEAFVYTNIITTTNAIFHCRFGASRPGWPPGVLAITDEGTIIFVSDKDGKMTISPDKYGVDP